MKKGILVGVIGLIVGVIAWFIWQCCKVGFFAVSGCDEVDGDRGMDNLREYIDAGRNLFRKVAKK